MRSFGVSPSEFISKGVGRGSPRVKSKEVNGAREGKVGRQTPLKVLEWVKRWPALDGNGEVEIEIRQVYEAEDFGDAFTPELREAEERLRARTGN